MYLDQMLAHDRSIQVRVTDPEKARIRERILRCQERRRLRAVGIHPALEQPQLAEEVPESLEPGMFGRRQLVEKGFLS